MSSIEIVHALCTTLHKTPVEFEQCTPNQLLSIVYGIPREHRVQNASVGELVRRGIIPPQPAESEASRFLREQEEMRLRDELKGKRERRKQRLEELRRYKAMRNGD